MNRKLLIATYNIDFQSHFFARRFSLLSKRLDDTNCDIIVFQEVPINSIKFVRKTLKIKYPNCITSYQYQRETTTRSYTEIIFSKTPFISTGYHSFEVTQYDRSLLWSTIEYNNTQVTIATSHLESMYYNSSFRSSQANKVHELLSHMPNVIFLGDFNTELSEELGPINEYWNECSHCYNTWFLQRLYPNKDNVTKQYDKVFMSPIWTLPKPVDIITSIVSDFLEIEKVWTSDHDGLLIAV